jgi:hypothetical protein
MTILECVAERRIAEAERLGAFDRLRGRGQPLDLEDDAAVPPEWRAAFWLLKRAGYVPEWIARGREIEVARAQRLEKKLASIATADSDLKAEAAARNRKIREYNLRVPYGSLQKPFVKS